MSGLLKTAEQVNEFMLAGNATITLVSKKTGTRFTYKVTAPENSKGAVSHFVKVLTGQDNEGHYQYLGQIYDHQDYTHGKKSKIGPDTPSAKAFRWFFQMVIVERHEPEEKGMEIYHEGKCGRCGRKLTVPESILRGIGPECANHL